MVLVGVAVGGALALVAVLIPWLPSADAKEAGAGGQGLLGRHDHLHRDLRARRGRVRSTRSGSSAPRPTTRTTAARSTATRASRSSGRRSRPRSSPAISIYSGVVLDADRAHPDRPPRHRGDAQQFTWSFTYHENGEDHERAARATRRSTGRAQDSRCDVIHSFGVPEWRMKKDAVPGIETDIVVTPSKLGIFTVICTELCGLGHATMRAQAVVSRSEGYENWLAGAAPLAPRRRAARRGRRSSSQQCGSCHVVADAGTTGEVGPNLDEVPARPRRRLHPGVDHRPERRDRARLCEPERDAGQLR